MGLGDLFDDLSGFFGQKIAPNPLKMGVFGYLVLNRHLLSFYCHFWYLEAIEKSPIFAAQNQNIKSYDDSRIYRQNGIRTHRELLSFSNRA